MSTESVESFDDFSNDGFDGTSSVDNDDWSVEDEEKEFKVEKEEVKEDLKILKDSKADEKGKVIKEEDEKPKKSEKKEEKKDEDESEEEDEEEVKSPKSEKDEEEEESEEKKEEKKENKKLRMRMGDELFNVDSDASFKVKIDGKLEDVPLQELINNFSGKTAWDKKFTEIGKEKKILETEVRQFQTQKQELTNHMSKISEIIKDEAKNPLDALMYIAELSNQDPYVMYRRMVESNFDEVSKLLDMNETERELYLVKKKDELHTSVARKRQEQQLKEQSFNQTVQRVNQLRQSFNVSEDDFLDASDELEEIHKNAGLDLNKITPEYIVDYASLKPHISVVKEQLAPYEDNVSEEKYGEVVATLSRSLRDGKLDVETVKELIKRNFSVEEEVKELNTKLYSKSAKKPAKVEIEDSNTGYESFDDWD